MPETVQPRRGRPSRGRHHAGRWGIRGAILNIFTPLSLTRASKEKRKAPVPAATFDGRERHHGRHEVFDFDVAIEPAGDGFTARVFNSPVGQAAATFGAPFSDLEIENFLLRVGPKPACRPPDRVAGDGVGQAVRWTLVQSGVHRRRARLPPEQPGRGRPAGRRTAGAPALDESAGSGRPAVGVPLQRQHEPFPRPLGGDAAGALSGAARTHPAAHRAAAAAGADDDLEPERLPAARREARVRQDQRGPDRARAARTGDGGASGGRHARRAAAASAPGRVPHLSFRRSRRLRRAGGGRTTDPGGSGGARPPCERPVPRHTAARPSAAAAGGAERLRGRSRVARRSRLRERRRAWCSRASPP